MQISQIVNKVDSLANTWEHYKAANDEKLRQIEKKGQVDNFTEQKIHNINSSLEEYKSRLNQIEVSLQRPEYSAVESVSNSEHKHAFINYLRKGNEQALQSFEQKSLSSAVDSDGGFLVEPQISKQIIKRVQTNSVMRQLASHEEISTEVLEILEDQDSTDAGWVSETEERKETKTPTLNKKYIRVHELYAQPRATQKLIDDARIDLEKWIVEKISDKFTATENHSFIYGDGKNQPKGILAQDNSAVESLLSKSEAIAAEDIINLYYSLGAEYASKGTFLLHRNTLQILRGLKSPTTGQYLWAPGLALGAPDTLLGVPVVESLDMPLPQKGNCLIAFADFKSAYKIVDRSGIRMLRDPYTDKPFVKFYATKRVGGDVINSSAIKLLKISK